MLVPALRKEISVRVKHNSHKKQKALVMSLANNNYNSCYLVYARHCTKCFSCIISYYLHNSVNFKKTKTSNLPKVKLAKLSWPHTWLETPEHFWFTHNTPLTVLAPQGNRKQGNLGPCSVLDFLCDLGKALSIQSWVPQVDFTTETHDDLTTFVIHTDHFQSSCLWSHLL